MEGTPMKEALCPRVCVIVIIGSLLVYFPLERLVPEWLHAASGVVLVSATAAFLGWCGARCLLERLHRV